VGEDLPEHALLGQRAVNHVSPRYRADQLKVPYAHPGEELETFAFEPISLPGSLVGHRRWEIEQKHVVWI
jgi:hypothetical protein